MTDDPLDLCGWPKCRKLPVLTYLGAGLCAEHWDLMTRLEGQAKSAAQKRLRDALIRRLKEVTTDDHA